jgi:putative phosphoesterase
MKICILSDSHDNSRLLLAALEQAQSAGAEVVLHCGDIIGTNTLKPIVKMRLAAHVVHGNNLGDPAAMCAMAARSKGLITYHGADADIELGGRRVFIVHYPHYGRAMAATGDYDLVCCGHSHNAEIRRQPNLKGTQTWLVNPGTVAGLAAPPTYVIGDLETMVFEIRELAP